MSLELSKKAVNVKPSSTLAITAKAKEMKQSGIDVVGFGAGEPDFNTPLNIRKAAEAAIENGFTKYTAASGMPELKKAVCEKFRKFNKLNYEPDQIVISNGGKHSLMNIFQAILNPGDEVIIPSPFWLSYPEIIKLMDGVPVFVEGSVENSYKVTATQIDAAITSKTKALVLNSPNNPTGMVYSREELEAIAEVVVKRDIYVVADEMYEYLLYTDDDYVSIGSLNDEIFKRTITCSGVSKSYAMTGWRIGYTGSSLEIAKAMSSCQSHETSNPNSIAQMAALEALTGPEDEIKIMLGEFAKRCDYMGDRFAKLPYVHFVKPQGAFYYFIDCSEIKEHTYNGKALDIPEMAKILLEEFQVAVVPCTDFGFPDYIRLSYATSMENIEKGMDRIEKFLNSLS